MKWVRKQVLKKIIPGGCIHYALFVLTDALLLILISSQDSKRRESLCLRPSKTKKSIIISDHELVTLDIKFKGCDATQNVPNTVLISEL